MRFEKPAAIHTLNAKEAVSHIFFNEKVAKAIQDYITTVESILKFNDRHSHDRVIIAEAEQILRDHLKTHGGVDLLGEIDDFVKLYQDFRNNSSESPERLAA